MSEHPKAVQAMMLANASVLVVNSENLHVLREGLLAMHKDCKQLLREQEAAEVRHAAELRELQERFSEVAVRAVRHLDLTYYNKGSPSQIEREAVVAGLASFIIPVPVPAKPVAWRYERTDGHFFLAPNRCRAGYPEEDGWTETPLYAGPTAPNGGSDAE